MNRSYFSRKPYLIYIMPAMCVLGLLILVPTVVLLYLSLTDYELGAAAFEFVGLENYSRLFFAENTEFWHSFYISLLYSAIVTSTQLILGFLIAKLLDRDMRFKPIVLACLIVPIAITPVITGQIWKLMLNSEYGVVNYLLKLFLNAEVVWLSADHAFLSTVLVDIWQNTPFVALIIYAGLRSLPIEPFEAAVTDGANKFQVFKHITLPLLKPVILLAVIFRLIDTLRVFDIPFALTQGGPGNATEFLSMHVYRLGFAQTGWVGRASAASVILMAVIAIISLVLIRMFRREVQNR